MAPPRQKAGKELGGKPVLVKLGTQACAAYNAEKCLSQADHLKDLQTYAFCLVASCHVCVYDEAANN